MSVAKDNFIKWIRKDLFELVREARMALEDFAEGSADPAQMELCVDRLHRVRGTLTMVQLHGAELLAQEMEQLAQAMRQGAVAKVEEASEALMLGMVQLPDYIDRIQAGETDSPLKILTALNEIRVARDAPLFTELELFGSDLARCLEEMGEKGSPSAGLPEVARQQRPKLHRGLLKWFRDFEPAEGVRQILEVTDAIAEHAGTDRVRVFFRAVGALAASIASSPLDAGVSVKQLLGKVDREIKRIIDQGEQVLFEDMPLELYRHVLYYASQTENDGERLEEIRSLFDFSALGAQVGPERAGGLNAELFDTVAEAVREDLTKIKDELDLFIRTGKGEAIRLRQVRDPMDKLADTLGMLGQAALRMQLKRQVEKLSGWIHEGGVPPEVDLMEMASAILSVESQLQYASFSSGGTEATPGQDRPLRSSGEFNRLLAAALREASIDMAHIKESINGFVATGDANVLENISGRFKTVQGALSMLEMAEPARMLANVSRYVEDRLGRGGMPESSELNALADVISSIEYFMESVVGDLGEREDILDFTRGALTRLEERDAAKKTQVVAVVAEQPLLHKQGAPELVAEEGVTEEAPSLDGVAIEDAFIEEVAKSEPEPEPVKKEYRPEILPEVVASEFDEGPDSEILDIFLEEANEEMDVIREQVPRWLNNFDDKEALARFRRSFHTLKGSGRLVGAELVGEFSWSVENLLNRIIDGTVGISDQIVALMREVLEILPKLIESETHKKRPEVDYQSLMDRAFALAQGRTVAAAPPKAAVPVAPKAISVPVSAKVLGTSSQRVEEIDRGKDMAQANELSLADLTADGSSFQFEEIEITEPVADGGPDDWQLTTDFALDDGEATDQGAADLPPPVISLDETLKEIFETESRGHLSTLNGFLHDCDPELGCMLTTRVTRALHTLHGSADMAGVTPIARLTKANERYFDSVLEYQQLVGEEELAILRTTVVMTRQILDAINVPGAGLPDWEAQVEAIRERHQQLDAEIAAKKQAEAEQTEFIPVDSSGLIRDTESFTEEANKEVLSFPEPFQPSAPREESESSPLIPPIHFEEAYESILVTAPEASDVAVSPEEDEIEKITGQDVELTEIFLEEAGELLEKLESSLHAWQENPQDKEARAGLQRVLHTLKGASRLAGVSQIGDLSHAFESLVIAVERGSLSPDQSVLTLARRVTDQLMSQVDMLGNEGRVPSGRGLVRLLEATQRGEFDGQDALAKSRDNTKKEGRKAQPGGSRTARPTGGLASPREQPPLTSTPPVADARSDLSPVAAKEEGLEARAERLDGAKADDGRLQSPPVVAEIAPEPKVDEVSVATVFSPFSRDADSTFIQVPAAKGRQDQIKVRADQLDRMVNNAGEISIYRTRIEQQNTEMGFNLHELDQTVSRLRQQLRVMEMETETQILFRYEKDKAQGKTFEAKPGETFDPLEMDRFSTIQQMSRSLAETVNDLVSIRDILTDHNRETETLLLQQSRVSNDLQDGLLRTRMVPFSQVIPRLQRLVRQTAQTLHKRAELAVEGGGGEVDRSILDRIVAPLEHILRNAVSHGIESPERRVATGKTAMGRILLSLSREGRDVVIQVADDGAGVDFEAVRKRAIERGLLAKGADIADEDLVQFLLEPGFSTATTVTQISGRGVGMDVVSSEVKQLGGTLDLNTQQGEGTTLSIRLPFTLALAEALLVNLGEDVFAVPHTSIEGVTRVGRQELEECYAGQREGITYAGNLYRVRYLGEMLEFVPTGGNYLADQSKWYPLLLVRHGDHRVAVQVDQMVGSRQIVVKSVGLQLSTVRWITGGTILGDGNVALILDVNALVRLSGIHQKRIALAKAEEERKALAEAEQKAEHPPRPERQVTVMVVDDSITVRKVTGRLLSRHNMNVVTAKDGVDALAQLEEVVPDIMLLDIEMPRMDGYELTRHIRHSAHWQRIPIIMITSRTGDKHRQRAMDLGVNSYLGKPYQEAELLDSIYALLAECSS